jgi:outer membrane putative beta-barrel porin/alpha-amylase
VRVEDAYPAERYAFEFLIPYSLERERGGGSIYASVLELAHGIIRNGHVGVKAPLAAVREAGSTDWGLSGLRVFALYNFNTESGLLPALSLRTDVTFPVGSFAGSETQVALKAIATRSWGRHRIHLNAAYRLGTDDTPAVVEPADRWWYGAAVDRTLFRQSVLVIGEVYARKVVEAAAVEVNAGLGLRWQWRPTTVFDIGLSRRLRDNVGPDYAVTFGISNAFAIAGLMPD